MTFSRFVDAGATSLIHFARFRGDIADPTNTDLLIEARVAVKLADEFVPLDIIATNNGWRFMGISDREDERDEAYRTCFKLTDTSLALTTGDWLQITESAMLAYGH